MNTSPLVPSQLVPTNLVRSTLAPKDFYALATLNLNPDGTPAITQEEARAAATLTPAERKNDALPAGLMGF